MKTLPANEIISMINCASTRRDQLVTLKRVMDNLPKTGGAVLTVPGSHAVTLSSNVALSALNTMHNDVSALLGKAVMELAEHGITLGASVLEEIK